MRSHLTRILTIIAVGLAATVFFALASRKFNNPLPNFGALTEFELVDQRGERFTSDDLRGKVSVAGVFFTNCQGICPRIVAQFQRLDSRFSAGLPLRLFTVSTDPVNDTPEVLSAYAEEKNLDTGRWHLVTGETENVRSLIAEGFHFGTSEDPEVHSERFVLLDRDLHIRGYYSLAETTDMRDLHRAVSRLLRQEGR
ncbi:MAG: SCO family protein [Verrucomicrobiales bacterium]